MNIDDLLREADPARGLDLRFPALPDEITTPPRKRRTRFAVIVAGVMAAVAAGSIVTTPAAAKWIGLRLHTGTYGTGGENDRTEFLNSESNEMPAYVDKLAKEYQLPPGYSYDHLKQSITQNAGLVQRNGLRASIAYTAQCAWIQEWLAGNRATATPWIERSAKWDIWPLVDPDGGMVAAEKKYAAAAASGDTKTLRNQFDVNCVRQQVAGR